MRLTTLLLAALLGWSLPSRAQTVVLPSPAAEKPDPATWFACRIEVVIEKTTGQTVYGVGSGTPVAVEGGKTLVLTNAHVVRDTYKDKPIVVHARGKAYPARYVAGSVVKDTGPSLIEVDGPDLCFLQVDADLGSVEIRTDDVGEGERVYHWGYGASGTSVSLPVMRSGSVTSTEITSEKTVVFSGDSVQGDSGAGVFDTHGKLVAVLWGGTTGRSVAVPAKAVRRFVERPVLTKLFPRLAKRLAEAKGVKEVAPAVAAPSPAPAAKPAEVKPPEKKTDTLPVPPAPKKEGPTPLTPVVPQVMPGPGPSVFYPYPNARPIVTYPAGQFGTFRRR